MSLIALSLVLLTGTVGQISLVQTSFAGVAGLALSKFGTGVPFPLSLLLAAGIAGLGGIVVGLPALRIRGAQLAIVTLAAAVAIERFVFGNPRVVSGATNLIPDPELFGINLSVREGRDIARLSFGVFVLVVVTIAFVLVEQHHAGGQRPQDAGGPLQRAGRRLDRHRRLRRSSSARSPSRRSSPGSAGRSSATAGASCRRCRSACSSASSFLAIAYLSGITSVSGALVAGALATLGIVYVIVDRALGVAAYYAAGERSAADPDRHLQPGRHLRAGPRHLGSAAPPLAAGAGRRRCRARSSSAAGRSPPRHRPRVIGDVLFEADEISVTYGGLRAVDRLSLDVRAGEIVGLIGPNGAGKTSFIDAVTGFTPCTGQVRLLGEPLADASAGVRARSGLVRTWQSVELFDDLSVEDNVRVSDDVGHDAWKMLRDAVRPNAPASPAVGDAIALVGLEHAADPQAVRAAARPPEAGRRGPLARPAAEGAAARRTRRRARRRRDRRLRSAPRRRSPPPASAACSSTTTCASCSSVCDRVYVIDFGRLIASGPDGRRASRPGGDRRLPRLRAPRRRRAHAALTTATGPQSRGDALRYVSAGAEPGGPVSQYILFFVLGLSVGAVYAALAMGIVRDVPGHRRHQLRRRGHGDRAAVRLQRPQARPAPPAGPVAAGVRHLGATDVGLDPDRARRRGGPRRRRAGGGVAPAAHGARCWPRSSPRSASCSPCRPRCRLKYGTEARPTTTVLPERHRRSSAAPTWPSTGCG